MREHRQTVGFTGRALCVGALALRAVVGVAAGEKSPAPGTPGTPADRQPECSGDVESPERLEELVRCKGWDGDLSISGISMDEFRQEDGTYHLRLEELASVNGSLWVYGLGSALDGQDLTISAPLLGTIDGDLLFLDMPALVMPDFPTLQSVATITFQNVNFTQDSAFQQGSFDSLSLVQAITFNDTSVTQIGGDFSRGFVLPADAATRIASITAIQNPHLTRIAVPGWSDADSVDVYVDENEVEPSVFLPDVDACSLNLHGVSNLGVPSLKNIVPRSSDLPDAGRPVSKGMGIKRQESSEEITNSITGNSFGELRMGNLTGIDGGLEISENEQLTTISFPALMTVTGELDITEDIDK